MGAPEFKTCLGCGGSYGRLALKHPHTFARSKYCGMECFKSTAAKRTVVSPAPYGPIAALITGDDTFSLISTEDIPLVEGRAWFVDSLGYISGGGVRLHRLIMRPGPGLVVDHIDGNKLNNQRANLRVVSQCANVRNMRTPRANKSGSIGVRVRNGARGPRWHVYISVDSRQRWLGSYPSLIAAIAARKAGERELWGEVIRAEGSAAAFRAAR